MSQKLPVTRRQLLGRAQRPLTHGIVSEKPDYGRRHCCVCRRAECALLGRRGFELWLCNDCYERLDQLDRGHSGPAFLFAVEIVRNREAARLEGVA